MSSFFVAFALGQVLAGPLSDRFGRKWLVLGGLTVFTAAAWFVPSPTPCPFLVLGRVIQALGACAASVLSRAIARDLFDGEALGTGSGADHDCRGRCAGLFASARKCA